MSTVRRIPNGSPAYYRPRFVLAEPRPRLRYSALKTLLWIGVVLAILFTLGGSSSFVLANVSFIPLPKSIADPPMYPGAQEVRTVKSNACTQEVSFTSNDTNEQIIGFYRDTLTTDGWHVWVAKEGGPQFIYSQNSVGGHTIDSWGFEVLFTGYSKKVVTISVSHYAAECQAPTPPTINISRQDYQEALAKWRSAGVEEYEITVDTHAFLGGTSRLHVSKHGEEILRLFPSPTPAETPNPKYIDYIKQDTVEGMFAEVERFLDNDTVIHSPMMTSTGDFYMAYNVEFDPDLGYPVRMSGYPVTAPGVFVDDADWEKTVTELKILKRSATTP